MTDERKDESAQTSTFAQRLEFARALQRVRGTWRDDQTLAEMVGVSGPQITAYKARDEAPSARRTLRLAEIVGVDPGWLAFGPATAAPEPEGFATWLSNQPEVRAAHVSPAVVRPAPRKKGAKRKRVSK